MVDYELEATSLSLGAILSDAGVVWYGDGNLGFLNCLNINCVAFDSMKLMISWFLSLMPLQLIDWIDCYHLMVWFLSHG